jgi:hypothetical protein
MPPSRQFGKSINPILAGIYGVLAASGIVAGLTLSHTSGIKSKYLWVPGIFNILFWGAIMLALDDLKRPAKWSFNFFVIFLTLVVATFLMTFKSVLWIKTYPILFGILILIPAIIWIIVYASRAEERRFLRDMRARQFLKNDSD